MRAKKNRFFHCFKHLKLMIGLVVLCGYVECCCVAYGQDYFSACKVNRAKVTNKDDLFKEAKKEYSKTENKYILPLSHTDKGFSYAICDESCYGYHVYSTADTDGYDYFSLCSSDGWTSYRVSNKTSNNNVVRIYFTTKSEVCVKDFVIMSPRSSEQIYNASANANARKWAASNQLSMKAVEFASVEQTRCSEAGFIGMKNNIIPIESRLESLEQNVKQSEEACSQEFLNGAQAAEGEVLSNGKCAATKCLKNRYLVVDSSGNSQGYCIAKKKCGTGKVMNVIDGTKTDNTCVCDTENGYNADPNNPNKCIKQTDSIADTTFASATDTPDSEGDSASDAGENADGAGDNADGTGDSAGVEQAKTDVKPAVTLTPEQSSALAVAATAAGATGTEKQQLAEEHVQNLVDANAALQEQGGDTDGLTQQQLETFDSAVKVLESNGGDVSKLADDQKDALVAVAEKYGKSSPADTVTETTAEVVAAGEDTVGTDATDETDADAKAEAEAAYEEAKEKYNKAKETEQSTANKMLGAAGMGATGVGGAMLMSGLAEQNADADAERAMQAYLATFTCKFGNTSVQGGEKEVVIPGGNELIGLYGEYVALANDLKIRKTALGMKPGIESEPILESATSGLYDDVSTGKTSGAYASLARALMDPNGEDAKKWNEQRDKTQENIKTGGITAASGAGISLVGDITNKAVEKKKAEAAEKKAKEEADKKASAN